MFGLDRKIVNLLDNRGKYGRVIYTRYADDLVISTDKKDVCNVIHNVVSKLIDKSNSPKLSLNPVKTKMGSSTSGSAIVTGLRLCAHGHITIHRKQKDHVRLLLSLYKKQKLKKEDEMSLLGHLAYIQHVDPQFYSKIQNKYFREIKRLKSTAE